MLLPYAAAMLLPYAAAICCCHTLLPYAAAICLLPYAAATLLLPRCCCHAAAMLQGEHDGHGAVVKHRLRVAAKEGAQLLGAVQIRNVHASAQSSIGDDVPTT
jgi:hypothetical protein